MSDYSELPQRRLDVDQLREAVEQYVRNNQPVEQDEIERLFGQAGLYRLRKLMERNVVSYDLDWRIVHEDDDR